MNNLFRDPDYGPHFEVITDKTDCVLLFDEWPHQDLEKARQFVWNVHVAAATLPRLCVLVGHPDIGRIACLGPFPVAHNADGSLYTGPPIVEFQSASTWTDAAACAKKWLGPVTRWATRVPGPVPTPPPSCTSGLSIRVINDAYATHLRHERIPMQHAIYWHRVQAFLLDQIEAAMRQGDRTMSFALETMAREADQAAWGNLLLETRETFLAKLPDLLLAFGTTYDVRIELVANMQRVNVAWTAQKAEAEVL